VVCRFISPSFRLGCELQLGAFHPSFHASPLRQHVNSLRLEDGLTISQLSQLNLVSLTGVDELELAVNVNAEPDPDPLPSTSTSPLPLLPPHFSSLELYIQGCGDNSEYMHRSLQLLMSVVGSCQQLESLLVTVTEPLQLGFTPLDRLSKLRSFELDGVWLSADLAHVLRSLPGLDEVSIGLAPVSSRRDFLRMLCSNDDDDDASHPHPRPHPRPRSQLKSLYLGWDLQQDEAAPLSHLPSLTSLHVVMSEGCSEVLPSLKLRHLNLELARSPKLLTAVSHISTLIHLELSFCSCHMRLGWSW